jgi:hypothetical protein
MNGSTTRRRFFGGAALLAAPSIAGAAVANDELAARLAALEDLNAIRALLRDWARDVTAANVTPPAANIRSLTFDADAAITVAEHGTASARVLCTIETATPIDGNETLVEMARQQGDGVVRQAGQRVLHGSFVKRDGFWHFANAELRTS